MGSYRSKEDDVAMISTSIYVTNFSETFSAKDLFNSCKVYGHVVDSFIPFKKPKAGKRFEFVRFINVVNEERLDDGFKDAGKSYVHVVTGNSHSGTLENESKPAIVLDDDCLLNEFLGNSILGRVKEFASLSNLRMALVNEGFDNFKLQYMGEFWVLLEFDSPNSKKLFHDNTGLSERIPKKDKIGSKPDKNGKRYVRFKIYAIRISLEPFRLGANYRSKEDDVAMISTSIYVTNFLETFSAKDLVNSCKVYGHVVDSFIPFKKPKAEKRFGFVRFINVVNEERLNESKPAIVLDDDCLLNEFLGNSILGRVKEFASLSNLRMALVNEDASSDFYIDGRIVWVEIKGVPFNLWSGNTFKRIVTKWGELFDVDDPEDTSYQSKRLCLYSKHDMNIFENFKIIFRGKVYWIRAKEVSGCVPDFSDESDDGESDVESKDGEPKTRDLDDLGGCGVDGDVEEVWRFYCQSSTLWARVMKAIHGEDEKIGKDLKACNQSCWLNIVNEITVLKLQGFNFFDFMRLNLGNGINISFWNDNWIGGNTLKNLYPRIYALENYKQVTVHMKLADQTLAALLRRKPMGGIKDAQFTELLDLMQTDQWAYLSTHPSKRFDSFCYDDDDEDYTLAVTPVLSTEEPDNSLSMRDEHLDTIPVTESDEFI
nr:nucleotide-binding alpha-beta plait domain-containing protein [Tanacetum cinerariifolium]